MLQYRVAWFQRGSSYPRRRLDVGILFLLLYLLTPFRFFVTSLSLSMYLSIYTTTNNKHQAPTSSPTTSDPTVVSILIVWCVAVGVQLHWGLWNVDLVLCTCAYTSLFIANLSSHPSSSACFSRPWFNCSATMAQWSVTFNKESQPSTYG
jgi:hypothetical protein